MPGAVDRVNRLVAAVVGLGILTVYWITLSPDVSFWDAGEFIAASHSLGIPHPPGTPLYVLMGRVFSIIGNGFLGIVSVAQAVNLLSAIPSAIAAVFLYLCVVRVGKKIWNGGDQTTWCTPAVVAGITAAMFAAFADTLWINSIESEVYAVSGMWTAFAAWLIMVWADSEPKDERLLVVIAYLLSLNIGVHLATYLAALAILPFAFLYERRFSIIVGFVVVLTLAKDLQFFLLVVALLLLPTLQFALLPTDYARRHRATLLVVNGIAVLAALISVLRMDDGPFRTFLLYGAPVLAFCAPWIFLKPPRGFQNPFTDLGFLLTLVTVLGLTCHLYLPIRSALDPAINEAQPDTWRAFWDVILRAQYRPVSVFERQAGWEFQFDHMFWRYVREQWKPSFLWWVLGVPGIVIHVRRHPRTFVLFGLLFLWSSFMLVLKMNFTDHEVRERDYFFAPGFFYFAAWMGLGLGGLTHLATAGVTGPARRLVAAAAAAVAIVIAAYPVRGHWETHDRRGNWVAYDYAHNMLAGLREGAVMFTNGDNDTFPLWYLQEVLDFRKDVRVVNLSLLNTPWYAKQLRDEEPRVPISLTDPEIDQLRPFRDAETGRVQLVKDVVARDILNTTYTEGLENGERRPVYFAVTVDDMMGLEPYLQLEGLVFQFDPDLPRRAASDSALAAGGGDVPTGDQAIIDNVDLVATRRNLEELYQYRGLLREDGELDPDVYRNPNENKLSTNYAAAWARMGLAYREKGDLTNAIDCMRRALKISPGFDPIVAGLGGMLVEAGHTEEADALYRERIRTHPNDLRAYIGLGYKAQKADQWEEALGWFQQALRLDPRAPDVLSGLYSAYVRLGRVAEAENVIERWLQYNPEDASARAILEDLRSRRAAPGTGAPATGSP
ncbi:MAG: membrane protein [Gemmatimonadota bacterium]|nr:MAG: membrane protein [Gemmatimonadota bacterium]